MCIYVVVALEVSPWVSEYDVDEEGCDRSSERLGTCTA